MTPILTIGITSYKRVDELIRCIRSIRTKYKKDIEIIVSEDKSPLSKVIEQTVLEEAEKSEYCIRFTTNEKNLGYDMNLGSIIQKAKGKYIFYMSDDDALCKGALEDLIPFIKSENSAGVIYAPFIYNNNGKKDRVRGKRDFRISPGEANAAKYLYDSILFSGLIFRREYVQYFDSSRFKNLNYFQVYMFLEMILKYGGYFLSKPMVLCIGDGENAYGLSESSGGNSLLANRQSVKSNLEFNKTLIKVIEMFDEEEDTHVLHSFAKQYSVHSISGLCIARKEGKKYFEEYWKMLNALDIHLYPITKVYYIMLLILGEKHTERMMNIFRKIAKKEI